MGVNISIISGVIKSITPSTPRDPKKAPSAVLVLQYGPQRDTTGGPVEFVNAVTVRVPSYRYPRYAEKLAVGQAVTIYGRTQGVFRRMTVSDGYIANETVADRIEFDASPEDPPTRED